MSLMWVFLLLFFIAPQAFAQDTPMLTADVVTGGVDVSLSGDTPGFELYRCAGTGCVPDPSSATNRISDWVSPGSTTYEDRDVSPGTTYRYQARHYVGGTIDTNVAEVTTPADPSLTASPVGETSATLTLTNHTGNWHYQETAPASGSCSTAQTGASADLTGLTADTAYTYTAYSDSACSTELASATFTTNGIPTGLTVTSRSATAIALSWTAPTKTTGLDGYNVNRCDASGNASCTPAYIDWAAGAGTTTYTNDGSETGTDDDVTSGNTYRYTVDACYGGTCSTKSNVVTAEASAPTVSLAASSVTETSATLTLTNHTGNWHYQETAPASGSCSTAQTGASADLTGLTADTAYTYTAYSDSACSTELASATFTTNGIPTGLTVTSRSATAIALSWTAPTKTTGLDGYNVNRCDASGNASCTPAYIDWAAGAGTTTYTNDGSETGTDDDVTSGNTYRYTVDACYGGTCSTKSNVVTAEASAPTVSLAASSVTETSATLTLTNHTGNWHYQETAPASGSCSTAQTGASADLTGLTADTAYTYTAYSDSACSTELASATFTTNGIPTGLTVTSRSATAIALSWTAPTKTTGLDGYNVNRCDASGNASCTPAYIDWAAGAGTTTYTNDGSETGTDDDVTSGNTYRYTVDACYGGTCSTKSNVVTAEASAPTVSLAASSVTETSATLTLTNHTGNWHYQETAPASGSCSTAQTGASADLTGLTADTAYTYTAYSDSACSTELASATFTTNGIPTGLTVTSRSATAIALSWTAPTKTTGLDGYNVNRCDASGNASCTPAYIDWAAGAGTTTYTNDGSETGTDDDVTSGNTYRYTVDACYGGTCSTKSNVVTAEASAPTVSLAASSVTETSATLTLTNHTGNWHYQETAPASGSCSTAQTGASADLTGLTADTAYTYTAYSDSACSTELASATFTTNSAPVYDLNLRVTASSASAITLSWTNLSTVTTGYDVYRCTVESQCAADPPAGADAIYLSWVPKPDGGTITLVDDNDTESGGSPSPINPGTTYYYAVQGYTADGDTGFARVTATAGEITPADPSLTASPVGETSATLTLTNHTGNWHYQETAPASGSCSTAQTGASADLTGLTAGTAYTYTAYSDSACSTELASATFTTNSAPVYDLNLRVTASSASAITLSWTNLSTVTTGYDVYRCTVESQCAADPPAGADAIYLSWVPKPDGGTIALVDDNDTESGGSPSPINPGTTYYYAVQGYTAGGDTGFSRVTATAGAPRKPKDTEPAKPAKPVGLIVASASPEAISLRWKPSSGSDEEAGYGVYRCTVPEGKSTCEPYDDLWLAYLDNSNTYTDTEVTSGETYRYQVAADSLGRDNLSRAVTVVAQMSEMVPPPTGLTVTETTSYLVRLSWTAPEDDGRGAIQAIDIYRCNVDRSPDCSEFLHLTSRNPILTEFRDNEVEPETTYRYVLASYRSAKEVSPWSNQVTATTKRGRYASPTGLTVTATFRDAISMSWNAPAEGILGYNIYRCILPKGESSCNPEWHAWVSNPGDAPPAPTSYTDTGGETGNIVRNLTYLYVVAASYPPNYRNGDRSEPVTATARGGRAPRPETPMFPPVSPTGFMAVSGESGIDLNWTALSDDIVGYSIYRCEEGETPCTPEWIAWVANEGDTPPAPTSYTDTNVTEGTAYRYAVTSNNVDSDGEYHESERSDEVTVVAREGSPGAPTNLTATPGNEQITLTWTPPAGTVTGWELLVRTDTDTGSWMSITPSGTTTESYTVTGLTNGVQYTFLVRAVNGMLKGAPAGRRGATTVPSLNAGEFEASFESGSQWFRQDVIPILSGNTTWHSIAWKGERIQQHLLVNNVLQDSRVTLTASDLTTAANDSIPASAVSFRYPRFVAGHTEARSCSRDYQEENTTAYLSDALFSEPAQALPPSWPELVWMTVDIPPETPPGKYSGTVSVRAVSTTAIDSTELHLSIQVVPWAMPDAEDRQFHLDLWQFPVSVLDRYNDANPGDRIELWSEEHYALLEPTYRYMAELGQRTVTTYIKEGALGAPSMIQWTLKRDGAWDYDYSVFDDYVRRLAAWGLDQQISAFSPVGWNEGDIPYWDEANQRQATFSDKVGSSAWNERWRHFLTDFRAYLMEKGWLDKTVLYLDESSEENVQAVIDVVETIDESWKIGLAYIGYGSDGPGEQVLSKLYDSSGSMVLVGTTYVDTGLNTSETYRYAVDGCNDDCSAPSAPVTIVAQTPTVPGEPTGLTGLHTSGIQLNWTAPAVAGSSAPTGYNVYRCIDDTTSCTTAWFGRAGTGATYTDSNVAADTTYRYRVAACNGSGCGEKSGEITVMTGDMVNDQSAGSDEMTELDQTEENQTVPGVPTDLKAFVASPTAIQLNWKGNATNGYDVYRCIGSQTCTPVAYLGWTYADTQTEHPNRISTFYTSCVQPRPNSFVAADADPSDVAALPWHALQRRQDGYLRWAFDNWRSSDPLDLREGAFTAGDFSLVYRSSNDRNMTVVPSIRSELLRDGIEDFEKVQVLRTNLSVCSETDLAGRWLDRLERTVDTFSSAPLMAGRAGDLIGEAHDQLGEISVQLTPDMCK